MRERKLIVPRLKKVICSICNKELTEKEYKRFEQKQKGLIFNWGKCQGKDAYPIVTTTDRI